MIRKAMIALIALCAVTGFAVAAQGGAIAGSATSAQNPTLPPRTDAVREWQIQHPQAQYVKPEVTDATVTCYPLNANYETGSINSSGSYTSTSQVYIVGGGDRGYQVFDVSAIPSGALITNVMLYTYCSSAYWPYWTLSRVTWTDPRTDPVNAYSDIYGFDGVDGYYYYYTGYLTPGWYSFDLGVTGASDLQARLATGEFFPVGYYDTDYSYYYAYFDGWNEANKPYIVVNYDLAVDHDMQARFAVAPGISDYPAGNVPVKLEVFNSGATTETYDVTVSDDLGWTNTVTGLTLAGLTGAVVDLGTYASAPGTRTITYTIIDALDPDLTNNVLTSTRDFAPMPAVEAIYDDGLYPVPNAWYFYEWAGQYVIAKRFPAYAGPMYVNFVSFDWFGPHSNSAYWPWPDLTQDVMTVGVWLDTDADGAPEEPPVWTLDVTPDTFPYIDGSGSGMDRSFIVAATPIMVSGDFFVGMINTPGGGSEGMNVDGAADMGYLSWLRQGETEADWSQLNMYGGDEMIRAYLTYLEVDIAATQIVSPGTVVPQAMPQDVKVKAAHVFGTVAAEFDIDVNIAGSLGDVWHNQLLAQTLNPGEELEFTFPGVWVPVSPTYTMTYTITAQGDIDPTNDVLTQVITVSGGGTTPGGWSVKSKMPGATLAKDGAWLATDGENTVYAAPGKKTYEFYKYDIDRDSWYTLANIPTGLKAPKKGSRGVYAEGNVYATKGNNTREFYRYNVADSAWHALADVPLGAGKNVKYGDDLAYVNKADTAGYIYLLKGYKNEFYKYSLQDSSWKTLPNAPTDAAPKYKEGSWLVYDGSQYLYLHRANANPMNLYKFDVYTDAWTAEVLNPMPLGANNKKAKDGSNATLYNDNVYAFKGGNTTEFWKYTIASDTWTPETDIPLYADPTARKKKVKTGADIVTVGDMLYAWKGNKTNELWIYNFGSFFASQPERSGVQAGSVQNLSADVSIAPNPLVSGYATLRYSLPKAGSAMMSIFDVTGRTVATQTLANRTGAVSLDLRNLSGGVYLVKITGEGFSTSQKLVVER